MTNKLIGIIGIISLLVSIGQTTEQPDEQSSIKIYLPREITVKNNTPQLGQVAIIRGRESLVARASEINMGRISLPGQQIIIDRQTVLSRLACSGIEPSKVILTGAEKITIKQQHYTVSGSEFAALANSFLTKNPSDNSACQWHPIQMPKDLVLPGVTENIKLSPRLVGNNSRYHSKVRIDVIAGDKLMGSRDVIYRLKYNYRKAVALIDIIAGQTISLENVKIEQSIENYPEPADWKSPYGLVSRCRIPADTVIRPGMIAPVKPAVVVKRNQTLVIRIEVPGLLVTTFGKAKQDGRAGEYIKVQNTDSQRIILAKVKEDGTVEPVF